MAITKFEDLKYYQLVGTQYGAMIEEIHKNYINRNEGIFFSSIEVQELINYLQSKKPIVWFYPQKKLPEEGTDVLWKLNSPNRHVIYSGKFSEESQFITVDNNDVEDLRIVHDIEDVKSWTYSNLILKYSEDKK